MSDVHSSKRSFESPPDEAPAWLARVLEQIGRLSELPPNWDSYDALAPSPDSIQRAREFITRFAEVAGIEKPDVNATPDGNVMLLWESPDRQRNLDLEILADGTIRYVFADQVDESRDEDGETHEASKIVTLLAQ